MAHLKESQMLAEPLALALEVIDVLERLGIPYWIGGSLATALRGGGYYPGKAGEV